jgi:hypothetical protein
MVPVRKRLFRMASVVVMLAALGCGRAPAVRHAHNGDFPALKKELDERASKNDLDDGDVRAVSRAILEHDLQRFSGEEGVKRLLALTTCAKPIESALGSKAKGDDDIAATAAWVLVDSGVSDPDAFTDAHRDDKRPIWRAVATRGLFDASEATLRAERALDDDERVRRAAMAAAGDAGCASDFPLLLEAARRDPIAIVRVDAVRALGKIAVKLDEGSPRADLVDRLNDLWSGGDEAMRGAVARALAVPVLFDAGGRQALDRALGREEGHATIDAASAMMGAGGENGALALARLAHENDPAVRAHAIRLLDPRRPAHAEVLVATLDSKSPADDPSVKVVAAEALLASPVHNKKATEVLVALMARPDRVGTDAAIALANAHDARAKPRLIADLATPSSLRFRVASALTRLGQPGEVRPLLASTEIDVRDGAACAVLSTAKGS